MASNKEVKSRDLGASEDAYVVKTVCSWSKKSHPCTLVRWTARNCTLLHDGSHEYHANTQRVFLGRARNNEDFKTDCSQDCVFYFLIPIIVFFFSFTLFHLSYLLGLFGVNKRFLFIFYSIKMNLSLQVSRRFLGQWMVNLDFLSQRINTLLFTPSKATPEPRNQSDVTVWETVTKTQSSIGYKFGPYHYDNRIDHWLLKAYMMNQTTTPLFACFSNPPKRELQTFKE